MVEYPKVLVISHNPFSNMHNNGKTLESFFIGWPKNKLAQLYITPIEPDFSICDNYYRITDIEVLKQFFRKKNEAGNIIKNNSNSEQIKNNIHKSQKGGFLKKLFAKRIPILYCIKNAIWNNVKPWNNKNVDDWIKKFKPDIIFFQSSNANSILNMVDKLCYKYSATLFMETTDDYVTKRFSFDPFYHININKTIKLYKILVNKSKCIFPIGDMMGKEYKERFGGNYITAMNSININDKVIPYQNINNKEILLTYAGNLGLNRWKSLYKLGKMLKKIDEKYQIKAKLRIYSMTELNKRALKKLNIFNYMEFKGSVNQKELIDIRNNSDILVHVESFDKKNIYITRLSISTKIPEYMLSKRCILAIGPSNIASIDYIMSNNMGAVISKNDNILWEETIKEILINRELRNQYIINAYKKALENHNYELNKSKIQNELLNFKE